ncbi:DUF4158 domain-containing protein [Kitasatospora sp. NPDC048545]|uniref:DUF4158 domain-containing protein n=1 Tax=Kitasatospora sp. NPDC048545 TaxID=3157208 RepID=UPI0033D50ABB
MARLEDPLAVPWPVVEHSAAQLGIEDPSVVKRYTERRQTLYDHSFAAGVPSAGAPHPLRGPDAQELDEDDEAEGF